MLSRSQAAIARTAHPKRFRGSAFALIFELMTALRACQVESGRELEDQSALSRKHPCNAGLIRGAGPKSNVAERHLSIIRRGHGGRSDRPSMMQALQPTTCLPSLHQRRAGASH